MGYARNQAINTKRLNFWQVIKINLEIRTGRLPKKTNFEIGIVRINYIVEKERCHILSILLSFVATTLWKISGQRVIKELEQPKATSYFIIFILFEICVLINDNY